MKEAKKKQQRKKPHSLYVDKHIAEENYSNLKGKPLEDRPYADYPFEKPEITDEMKKEEEEEYELYYS